MIDLSTMGKRIVNTPCCDYEQATQKEKGEIIYCTKCHNPFVEKR